AELASLALDGAETAADGAAWPHVVGRADQRMALQVERRLISEDDAVGPCRLPRAVEICDQHARLVRRDRLTARRDVDGGGPGGGEHEENERRCKTTHEPPP